MTNFETDQSNDGILKTFIKSSNCRTSSASSSTSSSTSLSLKKSINLKTDLGYLINDLRVACGDLCSIMRQIDSIAHRVEEKFSFIMNNLEYAYSSSDTSSTSSTSELISDLSNDNNNNNNNLKIVNKLQQISCLPKDQILNELLNKNKPNDSNSNLKLSSSRRSNSPKNEMIIFTNNNNNGSKETLSVLNKRNSLNSKLIHEIDKKQTSNNYNDSVLNKNSKNNRSKPQSSTNNLNKSLSNVDESEINKLNLKNFEIPMQQVLLKNNVMESSFYEDKLDNELESISGNQTVISVDSNYSRNCEIEENITFETEIFINKNHPNNNNGNTKPKPTNHVCFNLNNAIYTTRQDAPIPISVLKGTQYNDPSKNNIKQKRNSINKLQSEIINKDTVSNVCSSSISTNNSRKSIVGTKEDADNNIISSNSPSQSSKYSRTEPKTTIL